MTECMALQRIKNYDNVLDFVPWSDDIRELRPEQAEALLKITDALKAGRTRIVVSGPTGIGKSLLIVTIARWLEANGLKSTITSPLNTLVDQTTTSYGKYVHTLKGKSHYECECAKRIGKTIPCSEGYCSSKHCGTDIVQQHERIVLGQTKTIVYTDRNCDGCRVKCICRECSYSKAREKYKSAMIGNTNYTLYLKGIRESDSCFIDECQASKQFIRLNYRITIHEKWPKGLDWEQYLELLIYTLAEKRFEYEKTIDEMDKNTDEYKRREASKQLTKLERDIDNIERIIYDFNERREPWVPIFEEKFDRKLNKIIETTAFEPISTDPFEIGIYKPDQLVFYFSATPTVPKGWYLIQLKSPFDPITRPWVYWPVGSMSKVNREKTIPRMAKTILEIMKARPGKILVHCHSYEIAQKIGLYIKNDLGFQYIIAQVPGSSHYDEDGNELQTRNRSLNNFLSSSNKNVIYLSVNMWEGIDLYQWEGNEAVFTQVIIKVPFSNPTDPVVTALKKLYRHDADDMLNTLTLAMIEQGYGRISRNMKKWEIAKKQALTIICDSDWNLHGFWDENKEFAMDYFIEAHVNKREFPWLMDIKI